MSSAQELNKRPDIAATAEKMVSTLQNAKRRKIEDNRLKRFNETRH